MRYTVNYMKYSVFTEEIPVRIEAEFSSYPPLMRTLLYRRGLHTRADAEKFLAPDYERDIRDPFLIHDMDRAVARIFVAIRAQEHIVVYGDYDCDGIPGSVVLHDFFKKIGYESRTHYIPHRHSEGYGLNIAAVEQFAKDNATLLITVDCGITDMKEVARAEELGINVIVTDHHLPLKDVDGKDMLPLAHAVLNSKKICDDYHDDMLCGAGVAWKLVQALLTRGREEKMIDVPDGWEKWLLDMAGLSTIADMVPLRKENRALAHFGLTVLRKSKRLGLRALLKRARIAQEHLTEDDIAFMIAPRINAASRMGVPLDAFRLLATDDETEAETLAEALTKLNDERKLAVARIMKEVKKEIAEREIKSVIVIGNPAWRVGVLGIVANNMMEEYQRPVFVWGREGSEHIKGSCRSDGSVSVVELMHAVNKGVFIDAGGHEFSGGFSVSHEHIHLVEDALISAYARVKKEKINDKELIADAELLIKEVTWNTYETIARLAPFGEGNSKPLFAFHEVVISGVRFFGKAREHVGLDLTDGERTVPAISFFGAKNAALSSVSKGDTISFLAHMEKSMFKNRPELRLRIVDIKAH